VSPEEIARIPPELPDEFILSEGRPGKETGVFELVEETTPMTDSKTGESTSESPSRKGGSGGIEETEDEALSRHLLEEVQRTFIHLEEGSRGRCFDPRALVEACNCLKLEFDVWQQNDASEFAMKLLDRMEIALKKWAPENFRYLEHTFGLKQTKLKICKECGLKVSRRWMPFL
jgi:ubiquitin carboxyl-terminal hydrolase 9/24